MLLRDLLDILRSPAGDRRISTGLLLGVIPGVIPGFGLLHVLVWPAALALDASMRAMAVGGTLGAMLSPMADPLSHRIGAFLLEDLSFLLPLWRRIEETPIGPLTGFANTVVMGSMASALVLFAPCHALLLRLLPWLRRRLPSPDPRTEEDAASGELSRVEARLRTRVLLSIAGLAAGAIAALFFLPGLLRSSIEATLSGATGTEVSLAGFRPTLAPVGFRWERLEARERTEGRVVATTGRVVAGVGLPELLHRRVRIDTVLVDDLLLQAGEPDLRDHPAVMQSPPAILDLAGDRGDRAVATVRQALDSILPAPLHTPFLADSLIDAFSRGQEGRTAVAGRLRIAVRGAAAAESTLRLLDRTSLRTPGGVIRALRTLSEAAEEAGALARVLAQARDTAAQFAADVAGMVRRLRTAGEEDLESIRRMQAVREVAADDILALLFGGDLCREAGGDFRWPAAIVEWITAAIDTATKERLRGRDVEFGSRPPRVHVRRIVFSARSSGTATSPAWALRGSVNNLSSSQARAGEPVGFALEAEMGGLRWTAGGIIDRRGASPHDEVRVDIAWRPVRDVPIGNPAFATVLLERGRLNGAFRFRRSGTEASAGFRLALDSLSARPGVGHRLVAEGAARLIGAVRRIEFRVSYDRGASGDSLVAGCSLQAGWEGVVRDLIAERVRAECTQGEARVLAARRRCEAWALGESGRLQRAVREGAGSLAALAAVAAGKDSLVRSLLLDMRTAGAVR
jgi:uncharacterized protein (TIGR03546 family)